MNRILLPWRFLMALSWSGRIGLLMSLFWILMALFGGYIAPHSGMDIGAGPILGGFSAENCWEPIIWGGIC